MTETNRSRLPEGYRVFVRRATAHAALDESPVTVLGIQSDNKGLPAYQKCGGGRRIIRKRIGHT